MNGITFRAVIEILGVNPFVSVSAKQAASLRADWRKPMPVLVRINGKPENAWHINMMPKGDGSFYLYLHAIVRKSSATQVGDRVSVELQFDHEYRNGPMHSLPAMFEACLTKSSKARNVWDALSPSRKKEVLRYFASLKTELARTRNVKRMVAILSGKDDHFMGRDWINGK